MVCHFTAATQALCVASDVQKCVVDHSKWCEYKTMSVDISGCTKVQHCCRSTDSLNSTRTVVPVRNDYLRTWGAGIIQGYESAVVFQAGRNHLMRYIGRGFVHRKTKRRQPEPTTDCLGALPSTRALLPVVFDDSKSRQVCKQILRRMGGNGMRAQCILVFNRGY